MFHFQHHGAIHEHCLHHLTRYLRHWYQTVINCSEPLQGAANCSHPPQNFQIHHHILILLLHRSIQMILLHYLKLCSKASLVSNFHPLEVIYDLHHEFQGLFPIKHKELSPLYYFSWHCFFFTQLTSSVFPKAIDRHYVKMALLFWWL